MLTQEQLGQRKELILSLSKQAREMNVPINPPFELKQRIVKIVVDQVLLNVREGWLKLDGAVRGVIPIGNTPVDKDSLMRQG